MKLTIVTPARIAATIIAGALVASPAVAQTTQPTEAGLAADSLSEGETNRAIAALEEELRRFPGDPALLINLGIAEAQRGNDGVARERFEAALASREIVELETADGGVTDSRRLARRALAMLDRGEFRPATDRVTMR